MPEKNDSPDSNANHAGQDSAKNPIPGPVSSWKSFFGRFELLADTAADWDTQGKISLLALIVTIWVVYVPFHELLHALGCIITGGSVTEITVAPWAGGPVLEKISPLFRSEGSYAGRLTGFDTNDSDFVYFVTVFAPYIPTILFGYSLFDRSLAKIRAEFGMPVPGFATLSAVALGIALITAPVISLPGDFYELGSILSTNLYSAINPGAMRDAVALRSDDLIKLAAGLLSGEVTTGAIPETAVFGIVTLGFFIGLLLATLTLISAELCARAVSALWAKRDNPA